MKGKKKIWKKKNQEKKRLELWKRGIRMFRKKRKMCNVNEKRSWTMKENIEEKRMG